MANWTTIPLKCEIDVLDKLQELQVNRWLSRGQSELHGTLCPSIDRGRLANLPRQEKLRLERESISLFRGTARFFASKGERGALVHDFIALMVLRHYSVPTRLLDWSRSPYIAACFAVHEHDTEDGEIWAFDHDHYAEMGKEQWQGRPETTDERGEFIAELTAFRENPRDWVIAGFYPRGFPRQNAQSGCYTSTAQFDVDHADALQNMLKDASKHYRYIIPSSLKASLRETLREKYGVWLGSLFPDSAGAAETAASAFPPDER